MKWFSTKEREAIRDFHEVPSGSRPRRFWRRALSKIRRRELKRLLRREES